MLYVFRVDSSKTIGSGHLIRCMTLAKELVLRKHNVRFICRQHDGDLNSFLMERGFDVLVLPQGDSKYNSSKNFHSSWLSVPWKLDAKETIEKLRKAESPDWLIVDHYSIDNDWETYLRPFVKKIMVVDDLGDRSHDCDLLLDQNYCLEPKIKYSALLPESCAQYLGPHFALLNPAYAEEREKIIHPKGNINRLLIFFGGADPYNITLSTLKILNQIKGIKTVRIDVVLGESNSHKNGISQYIENNPQITLHLGLPHLAFIMSQVDLMIGSGGSTTWECCCLGVIGIILPYAKNQEVVAEALNKGGYAFVASLDTLEKCVRDVLSMSQQEILGISNSLLELTDGKGVQRIATLLG